MTQTLRHGLPLLAAGQAQKEVTHNEALLAIDCRLQTTVQTRSLAVPPIAPAPGAMFIVAAGASETWAGRSGMVASWDGFGWRFLAPAEGWIVWVVDEAGFVSYDGDWTTAWPVNGLRIAGRDVLAAPPASIAAPSGGSVVDEACRAAVSALMVALRNQGIVL
jgi:hypothetical protein